MAQYLKILSMRLPEVKVVDYKIFPLFEH